MDFEKLLKEAQEKIKELTQQLATFQKDATKVEELNAAMAAQNKEIETLKAFKAEADKVKGERDTAVQALDKIADERRKDGIKAFVKEQGAEGKKHILPKQMELITAILEACPIEKKFKHGEKDVSLLDMVKEYIESLPDLVKLDEASKKDKEEDAEREYEKVSDEVHNRTLAYQDKHGEKSYTAAMRFVLAADPDLKERYAKYANK